MLASTDRWARHARVASALWRLTGRCVGGRVEVARVLAVGAAFACIVIAMSGPDGNARATTTVSPATTAAAVSTLRSGQLLPVGGSLVSPHGAAEAFVASGGRLVVFHNSQRVWASPSGGSAARLKLTSGGDLVLLRDGRVQWSSGTHYPASTTLRLTDSGVLTVAGAAGTVWTSAERNVCAREAGAGHRIDVDLGRQHAWFCNGARQILTTPITSGASARGAGTPTGSWRIQSKQRDRYLYPAGGGAYFVHYWMPYDGDYGLHDSPWQHFPYGSPRYRTDGSHGCVHLPGRTMAFLYGWAHIGTPITISR